MKRILIFLFSLSILFSGTLHADEFTDQQEALLAEALAALEADPDNADARIWVGRRLGYLGRYDEAIETFKNGFARHPDDARFLRHEGHRYITIREFEQAQRTLQQSADMMAGKPNEIEPDGLPNAAGIPTSTLKGNIYYHLGLAFYLVGDFDAAAQIFAGATVIAENLDSAAASRYWLYLSNKRAGNDAAAERSIKPVSEDWQLIENHEYHRLILCFKNRDACAPLLSEANGADGVKSGTLLYGLVMNARFTGDTASAMQLKAQLLNLDQKNSFGYIAAEADG